MCAAAAVGSAVLCSQVGAVGLSTEQLSSSSRCWCAVLLYTAVSHSSAAVLVLSVQTHRARPAGAPLSSPLLPGGVQLCCCRALPICFVLPSSLTAHRASAGQWQCAFVCWLTFVQGLEILQTIPGTGNVSIILWHLDPQFLEVPFFAAYPAGAVSRWFLLLCLLSPALLHVVWCALGSWCCCLDLALPLIGCWGLAWCDSLQCGLLDHQSLGLVIIPGESLSRSNAAAAKMWDLIFLNRESKALLAQCALVCLELVWVFRVCWAGC